MAQTLPPRYCTECGTELTGRQKYTCSDSCRATRSRRKKNMNEDYAELAHDVHQGSLVDEAREIMREELRPVVREAITDEVYESVGKMVGLTSRAVEALSADLDSDDPLVRQRAYTLLIKYTIGHPAIGPRDDSVQGGLTVNIGLPGPDAQAVVEEADDLAEVEESVKTCDMCGVDKNASEFVANSDRCVQCFNIQRDKAQQYLTP
jgi:hypothetical protein